MVEEVWRVSVSFDEIRLHCCGDVSLVVRTFNTTRVANGVKNNLAEVIGLDANSWKSRFQFIVIGWTIEWIWKRLEFLRSAREGRKRMHTSERLGTVPWRPCCNFTLP